MFRYFRQTFWEPRGERWFSVGLIIESASAKVADQAFVKFRDALPNIDFDLLSRTERPGLGFRHTFQVMRPLGVLRLLLQARRHYDLVVLFATGERELRLCRAVALLVMHPKRFFVFNELGEGFWLNRENWSKLRMHFAMRYDWEAKRKRWQKRREELVSALHRGLVWLAWLPVRIPQMLYAGFLFLVALVLLAVLRATYDTHHYRFRFFSKIAAAPRRKLTESELAEDPLATAAGPSSHHRSEPLR